ncbi:DMT family transporter [Enterovirga rhinocerotis]|uniref:Drug/metabolite transporter (DMT)-like permease n=1 Tax=Enterovirga rhinocerotis TaxID=1339210 RepID=A0A4R7CC20_9HYPH|nr:DMT family transporter [Enterovirga rhinocerotis]TDR94327.1 drug/metabolite transporter (DMT)-like permease [Enterovirga rhinocerotis]
MDAVVLSLVAGFLIALGHVLARFGLGTLTPLRGAGISVPSAALCFLLLSPVFMDVGLWNWRVLPIFVAVGCVFPAVVTLLNFESNRRVGPSLTAALTNFTPVFAVLGAVVVLGEVPRAHQVLALAVILAGMALLLWKPERLLGTLPLLAIAVPIGAGALRGATQAAVKYGQLSWPDPYASTMIGYVASAVVILAVKAALEKGFRPPPRERGTLWFMAAGLVNGNLRPRDLRRPRPRPDGARGASRRQLSALRGDPQPDRHRHDRRSARLHRHRDHDRRYRPAAGVLRGPARPRTPTLPWRGRVAGEAGGVG